MPVSVIPFFSSLASPCLIETHTKRLTESGARLLTPSEFKEAIQNGENLDEEMNVFFIGTGGTENQVAEFVEDAKISPPFVILSHPANNSLPAAMEIRTYLERSGQKASIVHQPLNGIIEKLRKWEMFTSILEELGNARLGLVGEPSFWLIASNVNREKVSERWGITLHDYDLKLLKDVVVDKNSTKLKSDFTNEASSIDIPEEEIERASAVASILENLMRGESLSAVTVQCFDFLMDTKVSGCLALSHINNQTDCTAGCEGDVPSTFTMLLARLLTGTSGFMSNVTDINRESNSAVFAHCTVATSLVSKYEVTTHFESGMSVGIRGIFDHQDVTVFKVGGEDLSDYWVSSGKIVENLRSEDGCRTQIKVTLDKDVSYFLDSSLANHHVVIPGNHSEMIEDFFAFRSLRE